MQSNIDDNKSRRTAITPCDSSGCPSRGAPTSKIRNDLRCEHCQAAESTHLIYYKRYYQESGFYALINPMIVCDTCIQLFRDSNLLLEHQPIIVPFEVIGRQWDWRFMGILSKKGYEFNVFYKNKYWYKKLKRIKLIWQNPPKEKNSSR